MELSAILTQIVAREAMEYLKSRNVWPYTHGDIECMWKFVNIGAISMRANENIMFFHTH